MEEEDVASTGYCTEDTGSCSLEQEEPASDYVWTWVAVVVVALWLLGLYVKLACELGVEVD